MNNCYDEDASLLLSEARKAWRDLQGAQATINRLSKYARMRTAMVSDYQHAQRVAAECNSTIARILGGCGR